MSDITIDIPGKFDGFFDGTSLMQYSQPEDLIADWGQAGVVLREAYENCRTIKRGKGVTYRITLPRDGELTREAIGILSTYAETCAVANRDSAYGRGLDPEDRNTAYGEMIAGQKVYARCATALTELDAK